MDGFIRWVAKLRWALLAFWVAFAAVSVWGMPNLQDIVKRTEQHFLPANAESQQSIRLLNDIHPESRSASSGVIVLSREGGLRQTDREWMANLLATLDRDRDQIGITGIVSAQTQPELADQFASKDGTTLLAIINFPQSDLDDATLAAVDNVKAHLAHAPDGTVAALTGSAPITQEFQQSSQDGLRKTEILTIVLVLLILLIVFRSPVAPLIPLVTIGISLIISRGLIAVATDWGLPVSNFTESFLIAVLFGAGTDYCILMIQRFREELAKDGERRPALARTLKGVGKTVIFAASTVFAAFFLIGFARFGLYQSATGVAIGIVVTVAAGMTLVPAMLLLLGPAVFWPMKVSSGRGHAESRLWGAAARVGVKRPLLVIVIVAVLLAPITLLFQGDRSFDDLAEIDPSLGSVVGFRQVEKAFGAGDVFPVSVAIAASESMRTPAALAALEQASRDVMRVPGVKEVRNAVRPLGKPLTELTVPDQLDKTSDAIGQLIEGVNRVGDGLADAGQQLVGSKDQLQQLASGLRDMSSRTEDARQGVDELQHGLQQSADGAAQLTESLQGVSSAAASMGADLEQLLAAHPELADDPNVMALAAKQQALAEGLKSIATGAAPLSQGLLGMVPALKLLESGLGQLVGGQLQAAQGVASFQDGIDQLADGLQQGSDGLSQVAGGLNDVRAAQMEIAAAGKTQIGGWVLPQAALEMDSFQEALDYYISKDGKVAKFEIILQDNPYAETAMDIVDEVTAELRQSLAASVIADANVYASGTTARYNELRDISQTDFVRTGLLVLAGIALVLIALLRSILAPLYVLLSLGFNYFVTMGVVEFLFVRVLGYPGLSWSVSFFVFLIIVALGVDYSIFLMARFKEEYRAVDVKAAMTKAMTSTGAVIVSAAVIMGGTFGALGMSGVLTLVQIGIATLIGLLLYALIFMALVVPSFSFLLGEANWWPFKRQKDMLASAEGTKQSTLQG